MPGINETHPEIATQWHPTKNGDLNPSDFTHGSDKKVWWLCAKSCPFGCPHEWASSISSLCIKKSGCPFCGINKKAYCYHNSLEFKHPDVAAQWHPTKNGTLTPSDVSFGSHTKVWWLCQNKCKEGCVHEWEAVIKSRTDGRGCPYCAIPIKKNCQHSTIDCLYPDIISQWHPTKNTKQPNKFNAGSDEKVWWLCPNKCPQGCLHEWQTAIKLRCLKNYRCPFCSNQKILCEHISILNTHSHVSQQWHPTLNKSSPGQFVAGSDKKVWWLCPNACPNGCVHQWQTQIKHRCLNNLGCPFCSNQKVSCECVSIAKTHPELLKQWHTEKNINIMPSSFSHGSGKKVWWKCDKNHEWQAIITSRTKGTGCPHCVNKTEAKLQEYLNVQQSDINPQFRPDWCKSSTTDRTLPFDFCIPTLKLIIELDGPQHFKQISNWDCSTKTVKKDVYKMKCALQQGYSVLRILQEDVWNAITDWLDEKLKPHLVQQDTPSCTYITTEKDANIYDEHKKLMAEDGLSTFDESDEEQEEVVENEIV